MLALRLAAGEAGVFAYDGAFADIRDADGYRAEAALAKAKAKARELAPDRVRVNAFAPGMTETELLVGKIDAVGKRRVAEGVQLGRLASAQDIANACLFLASNQSAYITGVVLDVSGGLHIH